MYVKITDGLVTAYPYNPWYLRTDNPTTSFPVDIPDELLAEWGVYPVQKTEYPAYTYKQNLVEGTPELVGVVWTQVWTVVDKPQAEVDALSEGLRAEAYRVESDPLFFQWQRGELDKQVWLDKVAEIKDRYS